MPSGFEYYFRIRIFDYSPSYGPVTCMHFEGRKEGSITESA